MAELILALDLASADAALRMVDRLPALGWVKVGSVLFTREGPRVVEALRRRELRVFLDLKWHDIPNTVAGAVRAAVALDVQMATVHALGGTAMMTAAAEAAGDAMALVAVTVLTSHRPADYAEATGRADADLAAEAVRQALRARQAGLDGVVASPLEVSPLRRELGVGPLLVVPGIRPAGHPPDDQRRTTGPGEAVRAGASHLVVGRPVLEAEDPAGAWDRLVEAMGQ